MRWRGEDSDPECLASFCLEAAHVQIVGREQQTPVLVGNSKVERHSYVPGQRTSKPGTFELSDSYRVLPPGFPM